MYKKLYHVIFYTTFKRSVKKICTFFYGDYSFFQEVNMLNSHCKNIYGGLEVNFPGKSVALEKLIRSNMLLL